MYKKILLPIDGSDTARAAALDGVALAAALKARRRSACSSPTRTRSSSPIPATFRSPDPSKKEYEADVKRIADKHLQAVADAAAKAGVKSQTSLVVSAKLPDQAIVDTAKAQKCDLIVMGSHGRGGIGQLLLGSVTHKVLTRCYIPVLVPTPVWAKRKQQQYVTERMSSKAQLPWLWFLCCRTIHSSLWRRDRSAAQAGSAEHGARAVVCVLPGVDVHPHMRSCALELQEPVCQLDVASIPGV
jgi:nucleotide-binding universal stress UspA family protein